MRMKFPMPILEFNVGDRIEYVGNLTPFLRSKLGTVKDKGYWSTDEKVLILKDTIAVKFDSLEQVQIVYKTNIKLADEEKTKFEMFKNKIENRHKNRHIRSRLKPHV